MAKRNVVITGGSRGIGRGMAREFLRHGCAVALTSRSLESAEDVARALSNEQRDAQAIGLACDVRDLEQVQAVWDQASAAMGRVDIWINNAGVSNPHSLFVDLPPQEAVKVVDTNVIGVMFGVHVALKGMTAQGGGHIYNFEGFGSDGMTSPGMAVYGATKRAVDYFNRALAEEQQESKVKVIGMSPGIVITDMILQQARHVSPEKWEMNKAIYNCLGDTVETVAPFLVERALANLEKDEPERVAWLTPEKVNERFNSEAYASRDLFSQHGL